MKSFIKILALVLVLSFCFSAIIGCKSNNDDDSSRDEENEETGNVTDDNENENDGDSDKPLVLNENGLYMIYSAADLVKYRDMFEEAAGVYHQENGNSTFRGFPGAILMNDIDLSSVCGPEKGNWKPIGRDAFTSKYNNTLQVAPFDGLFDGNGHSISNLYIKDSMQGGALFQRIWEGSVTNLTVLDSYISCIKEGETSKSMNSATIAVSVTDGLIKNCEVTDTVTVESSSCAGGLISQAEDWNYSVEITDCKNYANVSTYGTAGGIIGSASRYVYIFGCENYGDIKGFGEDGSRRLGGIIGSHGGSSYYDGCIMGCINYGNVTETVDQIRYCGGIAGYNKSTIRYCINAGTITSALKAYDITYPEEGSCYHNLNVGTVVTNLEAEYAYTTDETYDRGANYSSSDVALTNGTALSKLIEESGKYWIQGESFPVWSGERPEDYQNIYTKG